MPIYAIKKISDQFANGGWASPSGRALAFGRANLRCLAGFAASIPDAFAVAFGDVIAIPKELRPARKMAEGGCPSKADGPKTRTHNSHPVRTQGDEAGL